MAAAQPAAPAAGAPAAVVLAAKLDHRTAPSFWAERDWVIDSPPLPRARPGDRRHDQLGNFQTALLGRITPASTSAGPSKRDSAALLLVRIKRLR